MDEYDGFDKRVCKQSVYVIYVMYHFEGISSVSLLGAIEDKISSVSLLGAIEDKAVAREVADRCETILGVPVYIRGPVVEPISDDIERLACPLPGGIGWEMRYPIISEVLKDLITGRPQAVSPDEKEGAETIRKICQRPTTEVVGFRYPCAPRSFMRTHIGIIRRFRRT